MAKPGTKNEIEKKEETTINNLTLAEDQQRYYISQFNYLGLSFTDSFVRITAYDFLAEDDIVPPVEGICRTYGSIITRHNFENLVSFYAILGNDFTDAHEYHQTLNLNDVHINTGQKQLTTPDCINNLFCKEKWKRYG